MDGLISQSIPNLINGVSQQDAKLRLPSQAEEQVNCRNSVVDGMGKRPNTELLAQLNSFSTDAYIQFIRRDNRENYILSITDGDLKVHDAETGVEYPVMVAEQASKDYLKFRSLDNPQSQFQTLTTADTTFILNKKVPVRHSQDVTNG